MGKSQSIKDIAGFCKADKTEEIRKQGYILTPGRYVGTEEAEEEKEEFDQKIKRLTAEIEANFAESRQLEEQIINDLRRLNHGPA